MAHHQCRIGRWRYDRASNELRCDGDVVRLEDRAARVLDVLLENPGRVVGRAELIERVWNGRQVSDNSVPMVIGQLRRALSDPGSGSLIETIPKRGYRLATAAAPPPKKVSRWLRPAILATAALLLALVAAAAVFGPGSAPRLGVPPLADQTGDPRYAALAQATDALLVAELAERGFAVERPGSTGEPALRGRLVMWEGEPFLAIEAIDSGAIAWSAMIGGGKGAIPRELDVALDRWLESRGT